MRLLDNPASPYCRKVKVLLIETGQAEKVEFSVVGGHPTAPNVAATEHNPLGKIPTLIRDDGPPLYDSRVICRYLDSQGADGLYPEDRLWDTLTVEATGDGIMDAAVLMVYEHRSRPAEKQDPAWIDAQWTKASQSLDALENRWLDHLGGPLDIGQIAVGCALGYLDFRHAGRDWRAGRPGLAAWFKEFSQRSAMMETAPPSD